MEQLELGEAFGATKEQIAYLESQARELHGVAAGRLNDQLLQPDVPLSVDQVPDAMGVVTIPETLGSGGVSQVGVGVRFYKSAVGWYPDSGTKVTEIHQRAIGLGAAKYFSLDAFESEIEREIWRRYYSVTVALAALQDVSVAPRFVVFDHALSLATQDIRVFQGQAGRRGPLPRLKGSLRELAALSQQKGLIVLGVQTRYRGTELILHLDDLLHRDVREKGRIRELPSRVFGNDFVFLNGFDPGSDWATTLQVRRRLSSRIEFVSQLPSVVAPSNETLFRVSAEEQVGTFYYRKVDRAYARLEVLLNGPCSMVEERLSIGARQDLATFLRYHLGSGLMPRVSESALEKLGYPNATAS